MVTVTVSSTAGAPVGNVSLSVDGGTAAALTLSPVSAIASRANIAANGLSIGTHSLSANYAAQGNFTASSATGSLIVKQPHLYLPVILKP